MTPEEIDALPRVTPAQMVAYFDSIIVSGKAGKTYSIRGRSMTFPSLSELQQLRAYYDGLAKEEAAAVDDTPMGRVTYARFERPGR